MTHSDSIMSSFEHSKTQSSSSTAPAPERRRSLESLQISIRKMNELYHTKMDRIVQDASALKLRLDTNAHHLISISESDIFQILDKTILAKLTSAKDRLGTLADAAYRVKATLVDDTTDLTGIVIQINSSWQSLSQEIEQFLLEVDQKRNERERNTDLRNQFVNLTYTLIEGKTSENLSPAPIAVRCQLRATTLTRRFKLWEKHPKPLQHQLITNCVDDITAVLDLYVEYFSFLWTQISQDIRLISELDNSIHRENGWSQEWCIQELESHAKSLRDLNMFCINTKCKALQERYSLNGRFTEFCKDAYNLTLSCSKLIDFIVPALKVHHGDLSYRAEEQLHFFLESKYQSCLWTEELNGPFVEWIEWFLADSGWITEQSDVKTQDLFAPFRTFWRQHAFTSKRLLLISQERIAAEEVKKGLAAEEEKKGLAEVLQYRTFEENWSIDSSFDLSSSSTSEDESGEEKKQVTSPKSKDTLKKRTIHIGGDEENEVGAEFLSMSSTRDAVF